MEFGAILVNAGTVRRVVRNGKTWLVAPMTTIVPGVLPGSKGPLFYPHDEIKSSVRAWDNVPITVYHPQTWNGMHASANAPGVMARQGIGFLKNSKWKGKLVHEGWFDEVKTRRIDSRILNALLTGAPMEVSTGLFTTNVPRAGNYNGRPYTHVAKSYIPDHLAVLPDHTGACSVNDGCGLNVNTYCPTGPGGGQDNTCSPKSGKGGSSPAAPTTIGATIKAIAKKIGAVKGKVSEALTAFVDKAPGGKALREKIKALTEKLGERYGKETMGRIVKAANIISWGATATGAAMGVPIVVPASGLMLAGVALAEAHLQIKRAIGGRRTAPAMNAAVTDATIQAEARRLVSAIHREVAEYHGGKTQNTRGPDKDGCGDGG